MKFILFFLLFISAVAMGQTEDSAKYVHYKYQYGSRMPRFWSDSAQHIPYGDTALFGKPQAPGFLMMHTDKRVYKWDGAKWIGIGHATQLTDSSFVVGGDTITIGTSADSTVFATVYRVDTATANIRRTYGKVYNVQDYGAIGDGRRVFDAAISASSATLTSATANFTSADVGKAIRVPYAAASGADLITTISGFTNSTTVTLATPASSTVSADTIVWGTDNTAYIQKALDTCFAYGGGKVYIPNGVYVVAGALRTSVNGVNPNCQIYLPLARSGGTGSAAFINRTAILIEGETAPNFSTNPTSVDTLTSWKGTVLYSLINGSGQAPAMFGTKSLPNFGDSVNYSYVGFKDLTILVSKNRNGGGPSIGGINMFFGTPYLFENLLVAMDGSAFTSVQPTNEVAGIIASKIGGETMSTFKRVHVAGFKYGICVADHGNLDQAEVFFCENAFVFMTNFQAAQANRILSVWCINSIFVPTANILSLTNSGGFPSYFNVDQLVAEVFNGDAPGWFNYSFVIKDQSNQGRGDINYNVVQANVGVNNTLFNKTGGGNLNCVQLGKPAWFTTGNDIATTNTGITTINSPTLNINSTTTIDSHNFFVTNGSAGFGLNALNFPLTRNGIAVKALTADGAEIQVIPNTSGPPNGTFIGAIGSDGYLINRLNGNLVFGANNTNYVQLRSTGELNIGNFTDQGAFTLQNTGGFYQSGAVRLNLGSDATGDIYYRNSGGAFTKLNIGSAGNFLQVSSGLPSWQSTLGVANGGTGNASLTAYALLAGGTTGTGALQQVSGTGTSGQVLTSNGAGALPTWQTLTLKGQATWDPASIGANSSTSTTLSVTGAALGDPVTISKTSGSYSNGELYFAYVSAADTVTIQLQNVSGGTFDIASATYNVIVLKY